MINLRNTLTITKKELRGYFNSPTAYIVLVIFLLLWEFLFFRDAFLVGEASLRILFNLLPWLMLILIPAITMGSVSQEKGEGTLELLLTHPLKDIELLAGKFFGSLAFVTAALTFIFPIALSFDKFGDLDWGVVVGQYLASIFFAAVFIALGIFVSSLFESQISSLLLTAATGFLLIVAGLNLVTVILPSAAAQISERLSALSHFESMSRGVIDLRDLWYFLSATIIFLSLAYLQLLKRRFGKRRKLYRSYQTGIGLLIGIVVLTNIVGSRIPGRIDLTQERLYTLSDATQRTLSELDDLVNITLFASKELPAQFQPTLRDTKDILRDYETLGKGNIVVTEKNPSDNPDAAQEASSLGVQEVQFNVVGREEFQVKTGYLGLAASYGGENETIPFIENTADLEYQLTSFIKKLTTEDKKKVVFLSGHGEKSIYSDYGLLNGELEKQFEVSELSLEASGEEEEEKQLPEDTAVLVIAGPTQAIEESTRAKIKEFLDSNGSALFMIDGVTVNPQMMNATANTESFADFLEEFGVEVRQDLVYDLRSNETLRFGGGLVSYLLPYPLWARVLPVDERSPITSKIESLIFPWGSSISLDENQLNEKGLQAMRLLSTTQFAGRQTSAFTITPDQKFSEENLGEQVVAVSLSKEDGMRIVTVGDSDLLTDQFVQNSPENLAFGIGAISWLGQEESLASIKVKQRAERNLMFENETQAAVVKYGNMALALLAPAIFGALRLMRRRNLRKLKYT